MTLLAGTLSPVSPEDSLAAPRKRIISLLKKYARISEEQRTPLLRDLAEALVDARAHFERPDGSPDWKGRTYAYRVFVRDLYADAGVVRDEQASLQAAVRYHVGAVLRERLDDETLAEYDLIPRSPKERSADRRESKAALLSALTSRDLHGGALLAITTAYTLLSKIGAEAMDDLDQRSADVAHATLEDLLHRVEALLDRLS